MSPAAFDSILEAVRQGQAGRFDDLVARVYGELRTMARSVMRSQTPGTLQPTALVNEAYLRLVQGSLDFESRAHFFGAASRAMRQVLVEYARRRGARKRAGDARRVTFTDLEVHVSEPGVDILALHEALSELDRTEPLLCTLLELRYFCGYGLEEIAGLQGRPLSAVKRDWSFARAWLFRRLSGEAASKQEGEPGK